MTRSFDPRPLGREVLDRLLAAALRAPSAGNTQGCDFVVLEGAEQTGRYWGAVTDEDWRRRSPRYPGLARAPVVVLCYGDPRAYADRYAEADKVGEGGHPGSQPDGWPVPYWLVDGAFAVMTILLGATEAGIGAVFLGNFRGEDTLRDALGVPERVVWMGAVLLGEPARPGPPTRSARRARRPFEDRVHRGGW